MADATATVGDLRERVRTFVRERDWERFHHPKDLAIALSIEASELLERFLWQPSSNQASLDDVDRRALSDELADVVIYALGFANALDIDLSDAVRAKIAKNEVKYPADRFRGRAP